MNILYIEDQIDNFKYLERKFKKEDIKFDWMPNIDYAQALLSARKKYYDMVLCDYVGTYFHSFENEFDKLKHSNKVVVSGNSIPLKNYIFINKKDLVGWLKRQLNISVKKEETFVKTDLMSAASNDNKYALIDLIIKGENVNACNEDGWTPLMYAAVNDKLDNVRTLLAHGADIDAIDKDEEKASIKAKNAGHNKIYNFLRSLER